MKRPSNNTIASVLFGLMLFAVMGALAVDLNAGTGFAIDSQTSVEFTKGEANFGSGYISEGSTECIIDTEGGKSGCEGFANPKSLVLKNTGKTDAKIGIENTAASTKGIEYYLKWSADEGACTGGNMEGMKTYTELKKPLSSDTNIICETLKKGKSVKIDIRIKVKDKEATFTDNFKAVATA